MPAPRVPRPLAPGALAAAACLLVAGCGARSPLSLGEPSTTSIVADAGNPVPDASPDAPETGPTCALGDLSAWQVERYRDQGDYERTAVAVSGVPWAALKVKGGNIILVSLGLDPVRGIVFTDRIEIPGSSVYPVALDVDDRRFVLMTTSGINWNGDVELWRIDRPSGAVMRVPVGQPPADPAWTASSAIGLAGDDVVVAYARLAGNQGTIELRDDRLKILQSLPVADVSFTAVRASPSAVDVYAGADNRVHVEAGTLSQHPVDPAWQVIGGLEGFLVESGDQIRLTRGTDVWPAAWPDSQYSPPAIVRTDGQSAAFSLEGELTAQVGHVTDAGLEWLPIQSAPGAPGTGLGLLPVIEPGRLGLFYLGLEIPSPQQPLRYFGLVCR
jgi:hypothetical protein